MRADFITGDNIAQRPWKNTNTAGFLRNCFNDFVFVKRWREVKNINQVIPANIETIAHWMIELCNIGVQNFFQIFLKTFDMIHLFDANPNKKKLFCKH